MKITATKVNMTQIFDEEGIVHPVTMLAMVSDTKKKEVNEGEEAPAEEPTLSEGDIVTISGISKGKGFQGVVKRHGFHGGPRSHGQKHSEREPGSIGVGGVQRVLKGKRMAGRMGSDRITQKNVKVVKVDQEKGEIFLRGAVPGRRGTKVEIRKAEAKS